MGFFGKLKEQSDNPDDFWGSLMLYGSNRIHARALSWGLSFLPDTDPKEIAELGCGSGRNVAVLLMNYPDARVTAVEESPYLIEKITSNNRKYIAEGRCVVERERMSELKLEEGKYDLAVAFDTIYNWKDLKTSFSRIIKLLKPEGYFLVVNETDGNEMIKVRYEKNNENMTSYTAQEIEEMLTAAGYAEVKSIHHTKEQWIAVKGKK